MLKCLKWRFWTPHTLSNSSLHFLVPNGCVCADTTPTLWSLGLQNQMPIHNTFGMGCIKTTPLKTVVILIHFNWVSLTLKIQSKHTRPNNHYSLTILAYTFTLLCYNFEHMNDWNFDTTILTLQKFQKYGHKRGGD